MAKKLSKSTARRHKAILHDMFMKEMEKVYTKLVEQKFLCVEGSNTLIYLQDRIMNISGIVIPYPFSDQPVNKVSKSVKSKK